MQKVNCNNCDADDYTLLFPSTVHGSAPSAGEWVSTSPSYGAYHDIVRCNNCGLVYMNPRDENAGELYEGVVDTEYLETRAERAATFRKLLKAMGRHKASGKLLDVGSYGGIFLDEARRAGFEAEGIEPSKWGTQYAIGRGLKVRQGLCCKVPLSVDEVFDVVTMWDVIEHLQNPSECLHRLYGHVRPGGLVFISTHDISSLFARVMGRRYPWLMRFHLYHYSPATLGRLLSLCGFDVVETRYFSKHFSLQYLLNRVVHLRSMQWLKNIGIPVNMGDMFYMVGRKK